MTRHVDGRVLRAFDHRELSGDRERSVSRHLEDCDGCRERLATIRAIRQAAARETNSETSHLWPGVAGRVERGDPVLLPTLDDGNGFADDRRGPRVPGRAAVAAFVLLAASAVAVLGATIGPLDDWVRDALTTGPPATEAVSPPPTLRGVGVPVPPSGLVVELREADPDLTLRIETGAGELAEIGLEGADAAGRFVSGDGRVTVVAPADGVLEVRVPDDAAPVRITVDGSTILEVSGGRVGPPGDVTLRRIEDRLGDLVGS